MRKGDLCLCHGGGTALADIGLGGLCLVNALGKESGVLRLENNQ